MKEHLIFLYHVVVYDEFKQASEEEYGFCFGENFTEAMTKIEEIYGDSLEIVEKLYCYSTYTTDILTISKDIWDNLKKELEE